MKPNVRQQMHPTIQRLTVAGKFADGLTLDKDACVHLAKALDYMSNYIDAQQALDELDEARKHARRELLKEIGKCLAVVALFVVVGWLHG